MNPLDPRIILGALFELLIGSAWAASIMFIAGEFYPKWPSQKLWDDVSPKGWYHYFKAFWTVLFRGDAEWWCKVARSTIWHLIFWNAVL